MPKLNNCVYVRLEDDEKRELQQEADLQKLSMSDVARRRMFSDPVTDMNHQMALIATRSLAALAIVNAIFQKIEPDKGVRKKIVQSFKQNIIVSEEDRMEKDVD